jgi:hypothetical protein
MSSKGLPFFRCTLCMGVVSCWDIYKEPHSCPKCGATRISPTNLSFMEKIVQLVKHPIFWRWDEQHFHNS